jgi:hypothetical protein
MYLLEVRAKTIFAKLRDVYPECEFLIGDAPQLYPLRCLKDHCPRNANCMEKLVHRVKWFFDTFPNAHLLILYFAYRDRPGSTRAGLFWRDMDEPRFITMNRSSWEKMKSIGSIYEYNLPDALFLKSSQKSIIASP